MTSIKLPIKSTAVYMPGDGIYAPAKSYSVNDRINHRAENVRSGYSTHIQNCRHMPEDNSPEARRARYEEQSLERGIRPHGYSDSDWQQHLRDVQSEEHSEKCEALDAWRYEN